GGRTRARIAPGAGAGTPALGVRRRNRPLPQQAGGAPGSEAPAGSEDGGRGWERPEHEFHGSRWASATARAEARRLGLAGGPLSRPRPLLSAGPRHDAAPRLHPALPRGGPGDRRGISPLRLRLLGEARRGQWRLGRHAVSANPRTVGDRADGLRAPARNEGALLETERLSPRRKHVPVLRENAAPLSAQPRPRDSSFAGRRDDVGERRLLLHRLQSQEGRPNPGAGGDAAAAQAIPAELESDPAERKDVGVRALEAV